VQSLASTNTILCRKQRTQLNNNIVHAQHNLLHAAPFLYSCHVQSDPTLVVFTALDCRSHVAVSHMYPAAAKCYDSKLKQLDK